MRKIIFIALAAILCLTIESCFTERNFNYFYDNEFSDTTMQEFNNRNAEYRLQPSDILSVRVKGLEDREVEPYNLGSGGVNNISPASTYLMGYSISDSGEIHLPTVGKVYVQGLTVNEVRDTIQSKLDVYLKESTVLVHLVSFKVSLLGEVNRPGYYFFYNKSVTILEALSVGGDLGEFADRQNIILMRQSSKGTSSIVLDLTKTETIHSPYFYLEPNDLVYVPPLEIKTKRANLDAIRLYNAIFAGISTTISIILLIDRFANSN